jgi:hypothetical protein
MQTWPVKKTEDSNENLRSSRRLVTYRQRVAHAKDMWDHRIVLADPKWPFGHRGYRRLAKSAGKMPIDPGQITFSNCSGRGYEKTIQREKVICPAN